MPTAKSKEGKRKKGKKIARTLLISRFWQEEKTCGAVFCMCVHEKSKKTPRLWKKKKNIRLKIINIFYKILSRIKMKKEEKNKIERKRSNRIDSWLRNLLSNLNFNFCKLKYIVGTLSKLTKKIAKKRRFIWGKIIA